MGQRLALSFVFLAMIAFGGYLLLGSPAVPTQLSVAQGPVYDVYSDAPGGGLIASCVTFSTYLSLAAEPQYSTYGVAGIPDASCGAIVLVTETTVSSTTFSNPCPASPGPYPIQGCTYTSTSSTSTTTTSTTTQTSTGSQASASTSSTSSTSFPHCEVIRACGGSVSSKGTFEDQVLGALSAGAGTAGLIIFNRREIPL